MSQENLERMRGAMVAFNQRDGAALDGFLATDAEIVPVRAALEGTVAAVVSELVATVSILDKALERQAWWPEGDGPRRDAWERHRDGLADELDTETVMRVGISCASHRHIRCQ